MLGWLKTLQILSQFFCGDVFRVSSHDVPSFFASEMVLANQLLCESRANELFGSFEIDSGRCCQLRIGTTNAIHFRFANFKHFRESFQ